jgi:hypothetical protein
VVVKPGTAARQIRCTELTLMPAAFAIAAPVQWLAVGGGPAKVSATTPFDGRPDLRYFLGRPAKPVEPRHQRGVQGHRNSNRRGRNGCGRALNRTMCLAPEPPFRRFLEEIRAWS